MLKIRLEFLADLERLSACQGTGRGGTAPSSLDAFRRGLVRVTSKALGHGCAAHSGDSRRLKSWNNERPRIRSLANPEGRAVDAG